MSRYLLVRHAAHDNVGQYLAGRLPGVTLGAAGLAQASRLARRLEREAGAAIYCSPRERARQTAEAIAERLGGDITIERALDEIDFGSWSGRRFDDLNADPEWRRWNAVRSLARTPAGETMRDAQNRVVGLIERLANGAAATLLMVTHADVIKAVVAYYLGLPLDAWSRMEIDPASVTTLIIEPWGARLTNLNEATP